MPHFSASSVFEHSRTDVFRYHDTPGVLDRLIPPWEGVRIASRSDSLDVGSEVELIQTIFGFRKSWLARHTELDRDRGFVDVQVHGPFALWIHHHEFESIAENRCELRDRVEYRLPFSPFSKIAEPWVRNKLRGMFAYRHRITADDLRARREFEPRIAKLGHVPRIAVTGATGLVGRRVVELASVLGWKITRIARPDSRADHSPFPRSVDTVVWDPRSSEAPETLSGLDAVVHLAGFGIAEKRWSERVKQTIWSSRVDATRDLVAGLCRLGSPPNRFVSASGIGIFGDRGEVECGEECEAGSGYLSELASAWESASASYEGSGRSAVQARLGVVLHPRSGALSQLLFPAKFGLGGPIGSGRQYWPWVHIDDAAQIVLHLAIAEGATGPYHVVAPEVPDQRAFSATLGRLLHRPSFVPTPAWLLRWVLGEMADPLLLASVRATTSKLLASGYRFRFPELRRALGNLLGLE